MSLRLLNAATATNSPPANTNATGSMTAVSGANLVDGETFTIRKGGIVVTFEFDSNSAYTANNVPVVFAGGDTSTTVAAAICTAINSVASLLILATNVAAAITLTATVPGSLGDSSLTETVANATFAVVDMTGGKFVGFSLQGNQAGVSQAYWHKWWDSGVISLQSTAGSATMTFQGRIWVMEPLTNKWHPMGIGNATDPVAKRGYLNDGNTIAEDGADTITHTQPVQGLSAFSRIYLEVVSIGGTSTAITAWLHPRAV